MRNYIRNIQDMEKLYYSREGAQFIQKSDAPVISTTAGVYNAVYGAQVWFQLNMEANAFGCLPKVPWLRSGWRCITARSSSTPTTGVAENAAIPESTKPTFAELSTKPKTVAEVFNVSEVQEFLANSGDDAIGDMAFMRAIKATEHKEQINMMLLDNVTNIDNVNGNSYNNMESLDRIVSSYAEVNGCGDVDANDADIYSKDRDGGASWLDAQVLENDNTDRNLTDTLIRSLMQQVRTAGGNPTFFLTGYDSYATLQGLYEAQVRYNILGEREVKVGVNGIDSPEGFRAGYNISTLHGIPLILSKDVVQDTISRIYLLDTSNPEGFDTPRLAIKIAKPTQYFEAGMNQGDPFGINKFGNEGLYRTMGEVICSFFGAQGKLRDLK